MKHEYIPIIDEFKRVHAEDIGDALMFRSKLIRDIQVAMDFPVLYKLAGPLIGIDGPGNIGYIWEGDISYYNYDHLIRNYDLYRAYVSGQGQAYQYTVRKFARLSKIWDE